MVAARAPKTSCRMNAVRYTGSSSGLKKYGLITFPCTFVSLQRLVDLRSGPTMCPKMFTIAPHAARFSGVEESVDTAQA